MSIRGITRTFVVYYKTILQWVGKNQESAWEDTLLPNQNSDVLELDELLHGWRPRPSGGASLREHVPHDYRRRATRSDFWLACGEAFPKLTHRFCGKEEGEINHAERWFSTLRSHLSRLVRRTYSFSKSVARHLDALHLFIVTYNLQIQAEQQRR